MPDKVFARIVRDYALVALHPHKMDVVEYVF